MVGEMIGSESRTIRNSDGEVCEHSKQSVC